MFRLLTQVGNKCGQNGWQARVVGGSNEPPGAARWSELARGMPSAGSTVAGVSGAVDGEDEGEQQREHHLQWQ